MRAHHRCQGWRNRDLGERGVLPRSSTSAQGEDRCLSKFGGGDGVARGTGGADTCPEAATGRASRLSRPAPVETKQARVHRRPRVLATRSVSRRRCRTRNTWHGQPRAGHSPGPRWAPSNGEQGDRRAAAMYRRRGIIPPTHRNTTSDINLLHARATSRTQQPSASATTASTLLRAPPASKPNRGATRRPRSRSSLSGDVVEQVSRRPGDDGHAAAARPPDAASSSGGARAQSAQASQELKASQAIRPVKASRGECVDGIDGDIHFTSGHAGHWRGRRRRTRQPAADGNREHRTGQNFSEHFFSLR